MGNLGDNDEEAADKQIAAREPSSTRGADRAVVVGRMPNP